jgi:hypothetical protein
MQKDEPRVVDAKFKVIRQPEQEPWWRRLYIDWRVFAFLAAGSAIAAGRLLLERLHS